MKLCVSTKIILMSWRRGGLFSNDGDAATPILHRRLFRRISFILWFSFYTETKLPRVKDTLAFGGPAVTIIVSIIFLSVCLGDLQPRLLLLQVQSFQVLPLDAADVKDLTTLILQLLRHMYFAVITICLTAVDPRWIERLVATIHPSCNSLVDSWWSNKLSA